MVVVVDDDATGLRRFDDLVDVDDTPHAASITAATATAMRLKVRCPETHPGALPAPGLITSRQGRAPDAVLQGCPITGALVGPLRRCAWACVVRPRPERSNLETRTCRAPRSRVVRDRAPAPDTATIRRPAWFVARNGRRLASGSPARTFAKATGRRRRFRPADRHHPDPPASQVGGAADGGPGGRERAAEPVSCPVDGRLSAPTAVRCSGPVGPATTAAGGAPMPRAGLPLYMYAQDGALSLLARARWRRERQPGQLPPPTFPGPVGSLGFGVHVPVLTQLARVLPARQIDQ